LETRVEEASPGILTIGGSIAGSDRTSPGSRVSIRATGLNWLAKFPTVRLVVRIGTRYVPIESITPDLQSLGVSVLTVTMPSDISSDSIPLVIEVMQPDGTSLTSNPASISLDTSERMPSSPPIEQ
jgi:hypothetical protein